jgi:hypothetical protein
MQDAPIRVSLVVLLAALVAGCMTASTSTNDRRSPEQVTIADKEAAVDDCAFVTTVAFDPPFTLLRQSYPEMAFMTRDDVRRQLRREAAYAGGDTVLATGVEAGRVQGKTYDCGEG